MSDITGPPSVDDIPKANQLQQQLATINNAILALESGGSVTAISTQMSKSAAAMMGSVMVMLDPPISDPQVLADLTTALQDQADAITRELTDMGFEPSARRSAGAGARGKAP